MKPVLALLLALLGGHAAAQELRPADPALLYYVMIPLDGATHAEKETVIGFALQGRRASQSLRLDTRLLRLLEGAGPAARERPLAACARLAPCRSTFTRPRSPESSSSP